MARKLERQQQRSSTKKLSLLISRWLLVISHQSSVISQTQMTKDK
ncbi:hypothetical protein COO91_08821 [Nostoc flagelliforme CCNUN1]|uniref:Uncharacterized protein n=1 Tax=Nostoc flagelliforme CCNUN1 TaxID=2038116 RepID=A0A2K8T6J7_9NOSO|nr:hypothetical protein COO91_08821 [Nostoc flagelliforme CCNUN1]